MWWLVTTRPSGETKLPEPPLLKRIEAFCTFSSQGAVISKLYFCLSRARGGWLTSHMPSSAWERPARIRMIAHGNQRFMRHISIDEFSGRFQIGRHVAADLSHVAADLKSAGGQSSGFRSGEEQLHRIATGHADLDAQFLGPR